ncbi:Homeodomain-like domain-containing protein [Actinokineospora alba]|uniref:Homeodomain-like domain-containing protein n=1 Tax=Actinokineospora alba TaxID=504798 RepID=A0A1H0F9H1_9PSEU|nr:helix-turn-helix transcriptional regulator [Actinokineospora alba]TDP69395.1 regulatory LuxR family protein [Actinokineospora alba]SDI17620.1 Homeodomain-like domain-containing protein [Actinokineospora alba]SDN91308.1 Homeodomain-like domain-containing protein [Actinokineospora alba]
MDRPLTAAAPDGGPTADHPLRCLGVSETAERAYFALVRDGAVDVDDLAARLGTRGEHASLAVEELAGLGLVELDGATARAVPPRGPLDLLAHRYALSSELARESASVLSAVWAQHTHAPSYLELVHTTSGALQVQRQLHESAQGWVVALSIGGVGPQAPKPEVAPGTLAALARGVEYRVVYGSQVLHRPEALAAVRMSIEAGERARVFPDVPFNLQISERVAVLAIAGRGSERLNAVVVHHSSLYDGLIGVFETFWRVAVPVPVAAEEPVGSMTPVEHRELLTLLSAGLTDESIARELGVSQRTVARRIAQYQQALGAKSRFQLGVQAARQGWL